MSAALLSNHRRVPPFGLGGGGTDASATNGSSEPTAARQPLAGCDRAELAAGDVFVVQTPSGGGYGSDER